MSSHVDDRVERIRQATLLVYGRLGTEESHPILIKALSDISPQVRATAVDTFVEVGSESIIPVIQPLLNSPDRQLRLMAAVILSRISPRGFNSLIESHITKNLLTVYHNVGRIEALSTCAQYSTIPVLQRVLREQNQTLLDEIFYLLSVIYDPEAVEVITDSLKSDNARVQANAIEALEALTSPQTAQLIAPLFERDALPAKLFDLALDVWRLNPPDLKKAIKELVTDSENAWFRAITTIALGEIGASLNANGADAIQTTGQAEGQAKSTPLQGLDLPGPGRDHNRNEKRKRRPVPADLLGLLSDTAQDESAQPAAGEEINGQTAHSNQIPFTRTEIEALLDRMASDLIVDVRQAAEAAQRIMAGFRMAEIAKEDVIMLSTIEKIIFLKQVPFFQGMTINQLEILANICEEELFVEDQWIFNQGDPGGALYVIVSGQVGIEQEQKRQGSYARLATLGAHTYFGEMTLFDGSPRAAAAVALQDTLMLRIRREPLIALARQYPDLSLELIHILSERLRQANTRIAELTRSRPRELQRLFDKLD
jgi:CRP-like cAMP-binding protein/HEAT repeat protein